jgi:signal transduction histidine kinase
MIATPLVLAVSILLSYWLAGRALKPLERVANETSSLSLRNLERRVSVPRTGDEVARLALSFNELLDRLQAAFTELRRFTADASHELRTPLTVIQTIGEFALSNRMTTEEYCDTIGHMLEEAARLTQLTEALLMLARGEADDVPPKITEVALGEVLDAVCAQLRPLADDRKQTLQVHNAAHLPALTDANHLKLAVLNIIHNAIRFTPNGGRIDVYVESDHSSITIAVEDTGPGIPQFEQEKVFDRFYRSDRTRASTGPGFGLGLSLARSAIAKVEGTISVGRAASGGARISILIPLAGPGIH